MKQKTSVIVLVLFLMILPRLSDAGGTVTGPVQLTVNQANDFNPVISADGSKIVFSSDLDGDLDIYVMNSDGTSPLELTSSNFNDTSPSISANGSKIAYETDRGADADIWTVNSDGTGRAQLTSDTGDDRQPSISQDGLTVVFSSSGDPLRGQNPEGDFEIFSIITDGTGLRQLTMNTITDSSPSVNADGTKVAFQSGNGPASEIWLMNVDGTSLTRLTNNSGEDSSPSISADGGKVAFQFNGPAVESIGPGPSVASVRSSSVLGPGNFEVYVVNSDGTGLKQLSGTGGDNITPSMNGQGSRVAYVSTGDGDREVWVVNSDGSGLTRVTDNAVFDIEPSLDHTGQTVVFMSNLDGDFEIWSAGVTMDAPDVAVTQMVVPRSVGYNQIASNPLEVRVTVQNQGLATETFTVEFSLVGGHVLASQIVTLSSGASQNLTFWLNPQPLSRGVHVPMAVAVAVVGEVDTGDNTWVGGPVEVRKPGDVDGDGDVDLDDLILTYLNQFTTLLPSPYDIDNDNDVDLDDLIITFTHQFT